MVRSFFFYSVAKDAEETESVEHQLTDTFSEFHQWLFSEIAMHLNKTEYFSTLHSPAVVHSLVLNILNQP